MQSSDESSRARAWASDWRKSDCWRTRSVTSQKMHCTPMVRPCESRTGLLSTCTNASLPSVAWYCSMSSNRSPVSMTILSSRRYFSDSSAGKMSKSLRPTSCSSGSSNVSQQGSLANVNRQSRSFRSRFTGNVLTSEW